MCCVFLQSAVGMQARIGSKFSGRRLSNISERTSLISNTDCSIVAGASIRLQQPRYKVLEESENTMPSKLSARYGQLFERRRKYYSKARDCGTIEESIGDQDADDMWKINFKEATIYLEVVIKDFFN